MHKEVQNWVDTAQYDLETAQAMFKSEKYIYTVFMCHMALEKILKAKVEEATGKIPPRTHDLQWLVKLAKLSPDEATQNFLAEINSASVVTRYPDDFKRMHQDFSKKRAKGIMSKTKEVFQWIKTFAAS